MRMNLRGVVFETPRTRPFEVVVNFDFPSISAHPGLPVRDGTGVAPKDYGREASQGLARGECQRATFIYFHKCDIWIVEKRKVFLRLS